MVFAGFLRFARDQLATRRPDGPLVDPSAQVRDLGVGKLAIGGHLQVIARRMTNRGKQQAFVGLTGHNRWSAITPCDQQLARTQFEAPLAVGTLQMTATARLDKQRSDPAFEEITLRGRKRCVDWRLLRRVSGKNQPGPESHETEDDRKSQSNGPTKSPHFD
jgi:hypothetical protein